MIPRLEVPEIINNLMMLGATLAINISGGKDSQAMTKVLMNEYQLRGWTGQIIAPHANLGRADWKETLSFSHQIANQNGLKLSVVSSGDLVDRIKARMVKLEGTGKPHWPSSQQRYCTSDAKRSPIEKLLREHNLIISAEGIRAEESRDRAKKEPVSIREKLTSTIYKNISTNDVLSKRSELINEDPINENKRLAINWLPIHDWKIEQVWNTCGTSSEDLSERRLMYNDGMHEEALNGWPCHPCYVYGMDRMSCCFCIFGSKAQLTIAKKHNPELHSEYVDIELVSGYTFKNDLALVDI